MTEASIRTERIIDIAEYIEECLDVLSSKQSVGLDTYLDARELRDIVERRFETMTQACIDIARILLVDLDRPVPESNAETIKTLAGQEILSKETATAMAQACSFRNVLAHRYGHVIDDETVYEALQDLSRYRDFLLEVRDFLDRVDAL